MIQYNKRDLFNFPINTYVEIVDFAGDMRDIGVVIGISTNSASELVFEVNVCSERSVLFFHPSRLRRISNV